MKDFFLPPPKWLVEMSQPLANWMGLPSLPAHIHELLGAALLYSIVFYPISPFISNLLARRHYAALSRKKRLNWDAHVVSMVQSLLINGVALYIMFFDEERKNMDREGRVFGYTGSAGLLQAMAAGYFLWDLIVTSLNLDVFGLGTLAHAVSALLVYIFGFRPFVNYYGCIFILWELSTPFLNVHWFLDKVNMTGSRVQLYNGFTLLFTFFSCRLVYGTYSSFCVFSDILASINDHVNLDKRNSLAMVYVTDRTTVPIWLGAVYLVSNLTLNSLNFYWFIMMIRAVRKRFVPSEPVTEVGVDLSSVQPDAISATTTSSKAPTSRRRKA